ncbi:MAG: DUF4193 family protein [Actinomycetota bacterium]
MDDLEEDQIDDEIDDAQAEEPDEAEVAGATESVPSEQPRDGEVESVDLDLLAKKEEAKSSADEEDPLLGLGREERLETLAVKVIPPQPSEFVCKRCYLVKHQSQLKDKKRMLCRDCA